MMGISLIKAEFSSALMLNWLALVMVELCVTITWASTYPGRDLKCLGGAMERKHFLSIPDENRKFGIARFILKQPDIWLY